MQQTKLPMRLHFQEPAKFWQSLNFCPPTNTVRMIPLFNIHAYIYTCSYSIYFFVLAKRGQWTLFSWARLSWEFKSFFDNLLSFSLSVCLSVSVAFHISPEPRDQFQSILIQSILGWSGFKFIQMKETTLLQEKLIQHNSPQNTYK